MGSIFILFYFIAVCLLKNMDKLSIFFFFWLACLIFELGYKFYEQNIVLLHDTSGNGADEIYSPPVIL